MAKTRTLHAIGNAHIDPVWLWRWPEGLETIRATFRSALDLMNEYPDFVFTCSSSAFYALAEAVEPDMIDEIRQRVEEGRWELVGGWWVEPDASIPSGESLVRQGLYGQRYLRSRFGRMATIGYNPDTFGHPATLPQILRSLGLTRYVFMRPGTHEKALPGHVFRWRSPDGSEVLALRIARSYATWPKDVEEHVRACASEAPGYLSDYAVFYGVGNHGGGPTRANIESLKRMTRVEGGFGVQLSSVDGFCGNVEADMAGGAAVPCVTSELQYHARGCYTAHSGIKEGNRRVEQLLLAAERAASMAQHTCGTTYPAKSLEEGWKALLFCQFHDILAGTSLPEAYDDARDMHGFAAHNATSALYTALHAVARRADTRGEGEAIAVFNLLPWDVRVPVEIERGPAAIASSDGRPVASQGVQSSTTTRQRRTCFVADLPAMGFKVLYGRDESVSEEPKAILSACGNTLENDWWQVHLSRTSGLPEAITDRRKQVPILRGKGMRLAVMDDRSDTWSHGIAAFRSEIGELTTVGEPVIEENGPVRVCLRSHISFRNSKGVHRLRLYRDVPVIDGEISLMWEEPRVALKLCIPTTLEDAEATYEVPYGVVTRPQNGEEQPGQQWADLTGWVSPARGDRTRYGLALLNDSRYGFDAKDGELRMTLLRTPVYAHHDPTPLEEGVQYRYMDLGEHVIRYRLVPHLGGWQGAEIPRRAQEFNAPVRWVKEYSHEGDLGSELCFLRLAPSNVVCVVCKAAEDGEGIIIRAVEMNGQSTTALFELPQLGMRWTAHFGPFKMVTFRVTPGEPPAITETNSLEEPVPRV